MRYRLYDGARNDASRVAANVLANRGIPDWEAYMGLGADCVAPYSALGGIGDAVALFMRHFDSGSPISILVDSDPDGYCSAAMTYLYIKDLDPGYPVRCVLHGKAKAHGITPDAPIPGDTGLLIVPDAGTNDAGRCGELAQMGIDIIVLDHHAKDVENPHAVVVNCQCSPGYPNKELSGAGVAYRFLQALDDETWSGYADKYLDLCALGNISDVMDMRSPETRYLSGIGLGKIRNGLFRALIEAQRPAMGGRLNIRNVQWYVTPLMNGCIRIGSPEERAVLFRAMIGGGDTLPRPREGSGEEDGAEGLCGRAARICRNAKARQDRARDKYTGLLCEAASRMPESDRALIIDVYAELGEEARKGLDPALLGLIAVRVAERMRRPCILLNDMPNGDRQSETYSGSARNFSHSPVASLRDAVNATGEFSGAGHPNAFGILGLRKDRLGEARRRLNEELAGVSYESAYEVDFILPPDGLTARLAADCDAFMDYVGQGIEEPSVAVEGVAVRRGDVRFLGKDGNTIRFPVGDAACVQFRCGPGDAIYEWATDAWGEDEEAVFDIVGSPGIGEYGGSRYPQLTVRDARRVGGE